MGWLNGNSNEITQEVQLAFTYLKLISAKSCNNLVSNFIVVDANC